MFNLTVRILRITARHVLLKRNEERNKNVKM